MALILTAEDTPHNLELMTYLLTAAGHEVAPARTGVQALVAARARRPDLVVLDIQLPDLNGYGLLTMLRAEPELAGVPIVAVTAYAMVGDRAVGLAAGFDGYLDKPIDPRTFCQSIDRLLPAQLRGHRPVTRWSKS